ncbi:MAG: recombinase family protein, partial [Oscillospiraceae bacterium]|nr:recombinase family protein [Oscillospiraceae bacterium]
IFFSPPPPQNYIFSSAVFYILSLALTQKKFDILLVFMFDRLGRKADETPFVVEWFVKQGIKVWSVNEGEQRFESHTEL